ncbi:MAG TPA: pyrroloquinoline quinone-dependent dehydrogenase [Vicinamibacterales bacterium]|nr:pyrroloquinoline quinone-dependent dehydrogenase [Vicinamibacterales bacterium]
MTLRPLTCALMVVAACLTSAGAQQAPPSTATGEWPTYGGDLANSKYSPLDQIDASNFGSLRIAWRAKSPDAFLSMTLPDGSEWAADSKLIFQELSRVDPKRWRDNQPPFVQNYKATALMVGGTLYVNTPTSVGAAYDARTGALKWVYNPKSYESGTTTMSLRWNQRGVAYWRDPATVLRTGGPDERIYWGTGDGYLVAVDAKTGRPVPEFGVNGKVDLMEGLPRAKRGSRDYLNALTYSVQSPPIVVKDLVITPAAISSLIKTKEQIPGWMRAFDARTGRVRWTFQPIPQKGEFGADTWQDGSNEYAGKVTVWTIMSADEELGLLYLPTNTTAPDFYGAHRLGDNLFAESVVALDINTGRRVWHFQTVHHGLWDYDNPAAPNLLDITVNGTRIKALALVTKQGFVYTFDRATGKPVWPIEERPVPASDVPGERASATQPFPSRPLPFEYQGVTIDDLADFTPEIRAMAEKAIQSFRTGPLFTPPSIEGTIVRPGTTGGANWSGAAVDPVTGLMYIPSRNAYAVSRLSPPDPKLESNLLYMQTPGRNPQMPEGLPLFKPPYSRMTAIDMNTGDHRWMIPTGAGDRIRNNPRLKPLNLGPVGGDITFAGPLLTKTLLIYALTTGGTTGGARLVAFDKATGKELASTDLPGPAIGTPMTYSIGGKQYIAVTVQGRTPTDIPELVALTLP